MSQPYQDELLTILCLGLTTVVIDSQGRNSNNGIGHISHASGVSVECSFPLHFYRLMFWTENGLDTMLQNLQKLYVTKHAHYFNINV